VDQELVITHASEVDSRDLQDLFAICYGRDSDRSPGPEEWQWRYRNGIQPSTIWVAKSGERIVAQRPVVLKWVTIGGEHYRAAHFMDVMTHPDFRRKGLFTRLLSEATRETVEQDIVLCYSFPNEESLTGYERKSDWTHLASLPLWVKPLRSEALLRQRVANAHVRRAASALLQPVASLSARPWRRRHERGTSRLERIRRFDERFDRFCQAVATEYDVMMRRDSQHLNWRFIDRPSVSYVVWASISAGGTINGYVVARSRDMFGMQLGLIVEVMIRGGDLQAGRNLVARSVEDLTGAGADAIACVTPDHLPICQALRMEGFLPVPEWIAPRKFPFMVRPKAGSAVGEHLSDLRNWYLSWGDNDAV